jgi:SAM-dependent methyltransferase
MFPEHDPIDLFRLREAVFAPDLIIAAVGWLDLFTWLEKHPSDLAGICAGLDIHPRPADVLMTLCSAMGLAEREDEVFRVTEKGREFLAAGSPFDLRPYLASLRNRPICSMMLEVLRSGEPASWGGQRDEQEWSEAMLKDYFADHFTAAMDARGAYLAPRLAEALECSGSQRLLDIAGGSGVYACAVVERFPQMRAAVLERPPVDNAARRAVARRRMSDRVQVLSGDMFSEGFPSGFDLHLFSHVLHDWGEDAVCSLLAKSFQALEPGGTVAVFDCHLERDKSGPLEVAEYSVLLLFQTEGKCYSLGEMEGYLTDAGFESMKVVPTTAYRSLVTARKPR